MSSFLPCQDDIVLSDWATQLDRIFIPHSGNRFLRLVGPENAINLHLEPPRRGSLATLQVTGTPLLTYPEGLELKEISNAKCFADVYMLLEQQGLTKWHYPEPSHPMYHFHTSFWMYAIMSRLDSAQGCFLLQTTSLWQPPSNLLWDRLNPGVPRPQVALRESPRPSDDDFPVLDEAWDGFVLWREAFAKDWSQDMVFDHQEKQPTQRHAEGRLVLSGIAAHEETIARLRRQIEDDRNVE